MNIPLFLPKLEQFTSKFVDGFDWSVMWSRIFYNEVKRRIGEFLNFDKFFAFLKWLNFDFIVCFAREKIVLVLAIEWMVRNPTSRLQFFFLP